MFTKAGIVAAIMLLTWIPCESQYKPRPVVGIVTDKRGNTLPGAIVQLENTRTLTVQSYVVHEDGRYHFDGLNDDVDYKLRAKYRNYWSEPKTISKFNSSTDPEVDLVIPIE